ncbi:hypothetical protein JMJ35_002452 [Cladonia borealis]|uniref:Uncharacterized protein n=1 Tax=Cladonia borealis TaxID=184061 RepID=A0AA39R558_9LECA|nr:hypothetical protein JMJ35_002452 [Cladonia borealis]
MGVSKPLYAPLEPSCLRILSSPLSPASPLTPTPIQLHYPNLPSPRSMISGASGSSIKIVAPPTMPWLWSCHKCHTRYALGATRRCLHDGHYFCGGTTVDKKIGKTRRHRACASEFDYIGWEHFNNWKRESKNLQNPNLKHCETQCDFPSACHWKTRHTPKKEANFSFLDPECLGTEEPQPKSFTNTSSSTPERTLSTVPKLLKSFVKAAEKRTTQLTTLLSTLEEESNFASTPGYLPSTTSTSTAQKPPTLNPLTLNPLSLHIPVLDFSLNPSSPPSPTRPTETITAEDDADEDPDVDMTDWIVKDDIDSPPTSPTLPTPPPKSTLRLHPQSPKNNVPFDFSMDTTTKIPEVPGDDESPISPRRTAWEWTAGDIGIALSSPVVRYESLEDVDSEGEEGEGGMNMLWEKDVDRRVSV